MKIIKTLVSIALASLTIANSAQAQQLGWTFDQFNQHYKLDREPKGLGNRPQYSFSIKQDNVWVYFLNDKACQIMRDREGGFKPAAVTQWLNTVVPNIVWDQSFTDKTSGEKRWRGGITPEGKHTFFATLSRDTMTITIWNVEDNDLVASLKKQRETVVDATPGPTPEIVKTNMQPTQTYGTDVPTSSYTSSSSTVLVDNPDRGIYPSTERAIKDQLSDPDSFQYDKITFGPWATTYQGKSCWMVKVAFRAKNEAGGYARHNATAYVTDQSGLDHVLGVEVSY